MNLWETDHPTSSFSSPETAYYDYDLTTPLPDKFEVGPAYPGDGGNNTGNIGIILPNFGLRPTTPPFSFPPSNLSSSYCQVRFLNASTNTFPVTIYIDGNIYGWIAHALETTPITSGSETGSTQSPCAVPREFARFCFNSKPPILRGSEKYGHSHRFLIRWLKPRAGK